MKYYIIAGEASGDLHSSNLMKEIKLLDATAQFRGWGGDMMKAQGLDMVRHYRDTAYMGFTEVIIHLHSVLKNINDCKKDILNYHPDALILVDYPGFNLRIAEFAKQNNFNIFYYISPQVWAWKKSRVKKIKKNIDKMFVILPFEQAFYQRFKYDVDFVGHPLLDVISKEMTLNDHFLKEFNLNEKPVIALLPGSRKHEIAQILPVMLGVIPYFKQYKFVIAGMSSNELEFYEPIIKNADVQIVFDQTYILLKHSTAAIVTSGTASLETALFEVPEIVCYKGSLISYWIAKIVVGKNISFISLVNLIMNKAIVKELIQHELTIENLKNELTILMSDSDKKLEMINDYKELKNKLGGQGASRKTSELIFNTLKNR